MLPPSYIRIVRFVCPAGCRLDDDQEVLGGSCQTCGRPLFRSHYQPPSLVELAWEQRLTAALFVVCSIALLVLLMVVA